MVKKVFRASLLSFSILLISGCIGMNHQIGHAQAGNDPLSGPIRVTNYNECEAAGYVVTKSFPQRCITPSGQQFIKPKVQGSGNGACENMCGDGTCQQIVCAAVGCPCAETPVNCASDCASAGF